MRFPSLILTSFCLVFLLVSCISNDDGPTESDKGPIRMDDDSTTETVETSIDIVAVYLTTNASRLSRSDLDDHPEILVVNNLVDFQQAAKLGIQLWVDRSAMDTLDMDALRDWLSTPPQQYYPLVAVGCNNGDLAFRWILTRFFYGGPAVDWRGVVTEPGFSVQVPLKIGPDESGWPNVPIFQRAYHYEPSVQLILDMVDTVKETRFDILFFFDEFSPISYMTDHPPEFLLPDEFKNRGWPSWEPPNNSLEPTERGVLP